MFKNNTLTEKEKTGIQNNEVENSNDEENVFEKQNLEKLQEVNEKIQGKSYFN